MPGSAPPSFFARLWLAIVCLFRLIFDPEFAARVAAVREPAALPPSRPSGGPPAAALHLLAVLQREGRLIDFCEEDLSGFSDAEVGAAARTVHAGCRKVLRGALELQPILPQPEGAQVQVPAGFDPAAIRLTGNVVGSPPFTGTLRHHGWRAAEVNLPAPPAAQVPALLAAAEVELP